MTLSLQTYALCPPSLYQAILEVSSHITAIMTVEKNKYHVQGQSTQASANPSAPPQYQTMDDRGLSPEIRRPSIQHQETSQSQRQSIQKQNSKSTIASGGQRMQSSTASPSLTPQYKMMSFAGTGQQGSFKANIVSHRPSSYGQESKNDTPTMRSASSYDQDSKRNDASSMQNSSSYDQDDKQSYPSLQQNLTAWKQDNKSNLSPVPESKATLPYRSSSSGPSSTQNPPSSSNFGNPAPTQNPDRTVAQISTRAQSTSNTRIPRQGQTVRTANTIALPTPSQTNQSNQSNRRSEILRDTQSNQLARRSEVPQSSQTQTARSSISLPSGSFYRTQFNQIMASRQTRIAILAPAERVAQESWAQSHIASLGVCAGNRAWDRIPEGYMCKAGNCLMTDELIARGLGEIYSLSRPGDPSPNSRVGPRTPAEIKAMKQRAVDRNALMNNMDYDRQQIPSPVAIVEPPPPILVRRRYPRMHPWDMGYMGYDPPFF